MPSPPTGPRAAPPPPPPTPTPTPSGPAQFVANGPRTSGGVALTFHGAGDLGLANRLLQAAASASAPITVLAVGQWLEANPALGRQILAAGHELGNHTYTHPALGSLSPAAIADEIRRCADVLRSVEGTAGRWFRPSGIDKPTPAILAEAGLAGYRYSVGFDVDPLDYNEPGAAVVVSRVTAGIQPGSIVSLHMGYVSTVQAFPGIVQAIRNRGLEPVLLSDLLG